MKKVSTAAAKASKKISQQKLTIGLDLGDRSSWYCVLDDVRRRSFGLCTNSAYPYLMNEPSIVPQFDEHHVGLVVWRQQVDAVIPPMATESDAFPQRRRQAYQVSIMTGSNDWLAYQSSETGRPEIPIIAALPLTNPSGRSFCVNAVATTSRNKIVH